MKKLCIIFMLAGTLGAMEPKKSDKGKKETTPLLKKESNSSQSSDYHNSGFEVSSSSDASLLKPTTQMMEVEECEKKYEQRKEIMQKAIAGIKACRNNIDNVKLTTDYSFIIWVAKDKAEEFKKYYYQLVAVQNLQHKDEKWETYPVSGNCCYSGTLIERKTASIRPVLDENCLRNELGDLGCLLYRVLTVSEYDESLMFYSDFPRNVSRNTLTEYVKESKRH
ncbi:MAG: hypothetical protein AB7R69_04185 [Candidatus Babeliales bacterium]